MDKPHLSAPPWLRWLRRRVRAFLHLCREAYCRLLGHTPRPVHGYLGSGALRRRLVGVDCSVCLAVLVPLKPEEMPVRSLGRRVIRPPEAGS